MTLFNTRRPRGLIQPFCVLTFISLAAPAPAQSSTAPVAADSTVGAAPAPSSLTAPAQAVATATVNAAIAAPATPASTDLSRRLAVAPNFTAVRPPQRFVVPLLDPNRTRFPRSALNDFSSLVEDGPAGKHGFLRIKGDHFYWDDGNRARFWGINVANTSLQEPDADIDTIIRTFKTAGFNLIRLHHFDERGGIIDLNANDSQHFDAARLQKLDYWIYRAKQSGIYVYLDLLDYRRFKTGDGVVNPEGIGRAARPYNVFDPRLIQLQEQYARQLLRDHVNPYTGLTYADDPAIVMVELYDESGLFMRRAAWRHMPKPYDAHFQRLWNLWLKRQYGNTTRLAYAWTDGNGVCALTPHERLENGTVQVPAMTWHPELLPESERKWAALPRRDDGARFAYEIQRSYFRQMRDYLHGIGVKVPITATGRFEDLADLKAVSQELDFVGTNFYYDHPAWPYGLEPWHVPSYYHNHNPMHDIDELSMAASVSLAHIRGKPLVVREWNYCWPNQNRASGMVEAACYSCVQDIDAMILFVYETQPSARISYFNVRSDPSRWGLCAVAADIFLKQLIPPSKFKIVVPYGPVDTFTYTQYHQPFYALGWAERMENDFFDGDTYDVPPNSDIDLILSPGRSGVGHYSGAPAVLYTNDLRRDLAGRTVATPEYLQDYGMTGLAAGNVSLNYDGLLFDFNAQRDRQLWLGLPLPSILGSGLELRPIGTNSDSQVANGFVDARNKRFVFGNLEPFDVLRAALDAMQEFHGVINSHDATEQNVFHTDNEEILRDAATGRLVVAAPQFQALCGNMTGVAGLASGLNVRNMNNGTLVALSLDGLPLSESRHFMVKMVTDARNVDQVDGKDPQVPPGDKLPWRVDVLGIGPVETDGAHAHTPLEVFLGRRQLLQIYLENGSFELLVDGNSSEFYCDTPGTRFALFGDSGWQKQSALQQITMDGVITPLVTNRLGGFQSAIFPTQAALVRSVGDHVLF